MLPNWAKWMLVTRNVRPGLPIDNAGYLFEGLEDVRDELMAERHGMDHNNTHLFLKNPPTKVGEHNMFMLGDVGFLLTRLRED